MFRCWTQVNWTRLQRKSLGVCDDSFTQHYFPPVTRCFVRNHLQNDSRSRFSLSVSRYLQFFLRNSLFGDTAGLSKSPMYWRVVLLLPLFLGRHSFFFFFLLSRVFVSCFLSPSVSPRETPTAHLFPSDVNRDIHAVFFDFFFFKRDPLKSTLSSSIVIERRPAAFSRSIPNAVVFFYKGN